MTVTALRRSAFGVAALVAVAGAGFSMMTRSDAPFSLGDGLDAVLPSLAPALGLVVAARFARGHRLATWAALVGSLLTLALGVALYAAALQPDARPGAPTIATALVPLRQLVAVLFVAWAVWIVRKTRDAG